MIVTKTRFINYTRCSKYLSLEKVIEDNKLTKDLIEQLRIEEKQEKLKDILTSMTNLDEDNSLDLITAENKQLTAMMPYYKKIEELASNKISNMFKGITISSDDTFKQKYYTCNINNNKYLCYVDIYNNSLDRVNIIEVKATTSKKYLKLEDENKQPIFSKREGIYYLKDNIDFNKYKLLDRYSDVGKYIFDLAVQRYIIENSKQESSNINYYLAVLNHEYTFDGTYQDNEPVYGDEIITLFNFDDVTKEYQKLIKEYVNLLEEYQKNISNNVKLGSYCEYKKQTECKYFKAICGKNIPSKNSSLSYLNNGFGFKDENGVVHKGLELVNEGYLNMLDIPDTWIKNPNHVIQRNSVKENIEYLDKDKIKEILKLIKYPIYHLDFETFNCPLPRFKGEKCYSQSVFEFSLHIERKPGICDIDKDNYVYLANDFNDNRLELVQKLVELIKPDGTLLAQNVSFERSRINELAQIFPKYKDRLLKINENYFDLIYLLKGNNKIYEELGYDKEKAKLINYYHPDLSGSYSIKKTLPIFSDLSYNDLNVCNGTDAIITYANYPNMSKEELQKAKEDLITYCKQDTWAMVVILNEIRKRVNNE